MLDWQSEVRKRLEGTGIDPEREREIVEEIAQHLEDRRAELETRGATEGDLDASVLAELDASDALAERLRRVVGPQPPEKQPPGAPRRALLADFWQDLGYAIRMLFKNRAFAIVTVVSLALGIGANTSLFELLIALHLRTLPVADPQELAIVKIRNLHWPSGSPIGRSSWHADLSYGLWDRIRKDQQAFSGVLAWGDRRFNTATSGETRWARSLVVSGDYFRVLGVTPLVGHFFTAADDHRGCGDPGAVLSYGYWQREFAGDPGAIGRTISLDGRLIHVVGVMPPNFDGLEVGRTFDLAVPLCMETAFKLDSLDQFWLSVAGRLNVGWSSDAASAHLAAISQSIFERTLPPLTWPANSEAYRHFQLAAYPMSTGISFVRQQYTAPLFLLMGIAGFVLLIACTNLANLLLARASAREKEIAVRLALGASRGRLVRQLMVESLLIASLGATAGLLLAGTFSELLMRAINTHLDLRTDWRVLAFAAGLACLTALLFGLVPALRASRSDMGLVLKAAAGRASTAGGHRFGLRRMLVAAQVAFSFVLLLSATLFTRSLRNVLSVDTGFNDEGVLVVKVTTKRDMPDEQKMRLGRELVERLRTVPGVDAIAQTTIVPLGDTGWDDPVWLDGTDRSQKVVSNFSHVTPGYFATLRINLAAGRDFTAADREDTARVAIVNDEFARRLAGGANVVGRHLRVEEGDAGGELYEIVGMVRNSKYRSLREDFTPIVFVPPSQDPRVNSLPGPNILIRSGLPTGSLAEQVKQVIAEIAPTATMSFEQLQATIRATTLTDRLLAMLAGFFGFLAALVAAVGLYGVVSYSVARRRREIGIRVALGADRHRVSGMILRETGELLAIGIVAGIVLGLAATRAAGSMLYGLAPHDPLTVASSVALMAIVAFAASVLPAYRAASVDPIVALREE